MLLELEYNREMAVQYAQKWAMSRNPRYLDFENLGGDCTNFASQCIYAGAKIMNYTPILGWYYNSATDRTPSWTGVEYLYQFLVNNKSTGPYAVETGRNNVDIGDIVQLGNGQSFYHSPVIVGIKDGKIYVAAHSFDAYMRPLDSYSYKEARFLHILGVRKWQNI